MKYRDCPCPDSATVVAALQAISIDGCRMVGKRKVGELKGETVLIALQHQGLQTNRRYARRTLDALVEQRLLGLSAIHHNASQQQLRLIVLRSVEVGTDRDEAIVATHHHLVVQLGIIDIVRSNHRDDEAEAVTLRIQHATCVSGSHPDVSFHITHGNHLVANLPFLAIHLLALHRQVHHVALDAGVISYPHVAVAGSHEIVDGVVASDMGHAHGVRVDAVEMVMGRSPDHSLAIEHHLSDMQAREGILSLVGK